MQKTKNRVILVWYIEYYQGNSHRLRHKSRPSLEGTHGSNDGASPGHASLQIPSRTSPDNSNSQTRNGLADGLFQQFRVLRPTVVQKR